tara:strand:+ start:878 stop:1090 length:213 start_codon:yes stop_codon:yes gene_type:complete
MKTILLSIFGFLATLFFSYKKGASNQKQETENENYKNTLEIIKEKQEINENVDNLSDGELNKLLIETRHK